MIGLNGLKEMEQFILQDSRGLIGSRISWWREGGSYTTDLNQAEVFTRDDAMSQHASRWSDIPWPLGFVRPRHEMAVDFQYVTIHWVPRGGTELCYVAARFHFDGNDIFWLSGDALTTDLTKASVYTLDEAFSHFGSEASAFTRQIWPKAYVDARARPVASAVTMSVDEALAGTGITLQRPLPQRRMTPKCGGCGQFVTADQAPSGICRHCR